MMVPPLAAWMLGGSVSRHDGSVRDVSARSLSSRESLLSAIALARDQVVAMQARRVPRLNLCGLPPSLQGCFGLGVERPDDQPPAAASCSKSMAAEAPAKAAEEPLAPPVQRAQPLPALNLWGLPPCLQGYPGTLPPPTSALALARPQPLPLDPAAPPGATDGDAAAPSSGSDAPTHDGDDAATHEGARLESAARAAMVPRLDLQGLPPPRIYEVWPGLTGLWRAAEQQRLALALAPSALQLPTVAWIAEVGCSQCAICLTDFEVSTLVVRLRCGHAFHEGCIVQWVSSQARCPLCRGAC